MGNHISCLKKSHLTQCQYCLRQGIAISTFSYWIGKFGKGAEKPGATLFYPLTVKGVSTSVDRKGFQAGIRLSLCNDKFKIDLEEEFSATTLKKLIATLETARNLRMYSNQPFQPNRIIFLLTEQQKNPFLYIYYGVSEGYK
ncbi:MAG: hypothetical protein KJ804_00410 [Proteobacteria bacterium]|nr:hypothetical protein [Pseudomonadota bacterium]MBU1056768.1 hypothetical protein [Pseudomonadota bacterium]